MQGSDTLPSLPGLDVVRGPHSGVARALDAARAGAYHHAMPDHPTPQLIDRERALRIVRRLVDVAARRGEPFGSPVVLVGGTAMAALGLRAQSLDVQLNMPIVPDESVREVEAELATELGPAFKLDVTPGENVWGSILLRDIEQSPEIERFETSGHLVIVRALSVEDLFLLKLAADRSRDRADLPLLASRTTAERLVERFNRIQAWHGDRSAVMGFADALVTSLVTLHGASASAVIDQLALSPTIVRALREAHHAG